MGCFGHHINVKMFLNDNYGHLWFKQHQSQLHCILTFPVRVCVYVRQNLGIKKIGHTITAHDHQPTTDSCILSMVVGQLKVSSATNAKSCHNTSWLWTFFPQIFMFFICFVFSCLIEIIFVGLMCGWLSQQLLFLFAGWQRPNHGFSSDFPPEGNK